MAILPNTYNTNEFPESSGSLTLINPGQYQAVILDSYFKDTKKGDGKMLVIAIVISHGDFQGSEFLERLNIVNNNPTAEKIAYQRLARMSEAVGLDRTPKDSVELHNKPFLIDVVTEKGGEWTDPDGNVRPGADKSIIKKFNLLPKAGFTSNSQPITSQDVGANIATAQAQNNSADVSRPWAS